MTCYQEITCPNCGSNQIMKAGRSKAGTQRYRCHNLECKTKNFMLDSGQSRYLPVAVENW